MVVVVDNECMFQLLFGERKVVMVAFTTDEIDDYTYLCLFPFFLSSST